MRTRSLGVGVLKFSKKGDLQMMETMMVALVFIVVLMVGLGFYFKFQMASVEEKAESVCILSNTVMLSSITSMPEIQCSVNSNREECIDTSKLLVFDASRTYQEFFNANCEQRVYFVELYPTLTNGTCTQGSYPDCNYYYFYEPNVKYTSKIVMSTPVSLYYPLDDSYKSGKLVIEVLQ